MGSVLAIAVGGAVLALGLYLVVLLGLVRRRGFGAGRTVGVPGSGLSLQIPQWWSVETSLEAARACEASISDAPIGGAPSCEPPAGGAPTGEAGSLVRITTGNHRGVLELRHLARCAVPGSPPATADLASALQAILEARRIVLDEPEIQTSSPDPGRSSAPFRGAWVAARGRSSPEDETRSYFEIHLVERAGRLLLLEYTNSVLHGYLDAFYIQKVLDTIRSEEAPRAR